MVQRKRPITQRQARHSALLALVFSTTTIAAASSLPVNLPENITPFFETASDVRLADWDNDGRTDIIAAALDGAMIKMWRNEEFGWVESTWPITGNVASIDVGDIDGNGEIDLVYGQYSPSRVGVVLNRSSDLLVAIDDTSINGPEAVHLADLDGDGDLDAMTAEFGAFHVSWHENVNGDGETWTTHEISLGVEQPTDVVDHDVDLDGDLDLVVATFAGGILWIENRLGSAPPWAVHIVDSEVSFATSVAVADLDGDGETEIVATAITTPLVAWWDRPALLTDPWTRQVVATEASSGLTVADMDQDGAVDILTLAWGGTKTPRFWRNHGSGLFIGGVLSGTYNFARSIAVADLDLDGDLDVAVAGGASDVVETIENRLVRSTVDLGSVDDNRLLGNPLPLAMANADLDRDGDLDLISYDEDGVLRLRDTADSIGVTLATVGETLLDSRAFGLGDLDGDSDLDVVIGFAGRFAWFENLGVGLPFSSKTLLASARTTDLMIFDLTGDGDDDIIAYDSALKVVRVWRNVGPGSSWVINAIDNPFGEYKAMSAGDLDRDGTTELIISADDSIVAYTRIADIAYAPSTIDSGFAPPNVVAGDFDADGDVDIAGDVPGPSTLRYWANDGLGGFTIYESDFVADVTALAAADYDRDGDLDIVGTSEVSYSAIAFTRRTSPNPFPTSPFGFPDLKSRVLSVGDFTGDGYPDTVGAPTGGGPKLSTTIPGQYTSEFMPASSSTVHPGSTLVVWHLDLEHLGRPGDQDIKLTSVSLVVLANGQPLDASQMDGLFSSVTLLRDDPPVVLAQLTDPAQPSPLVLDVTPSGGFDLVPSPPAPGDASTGRFRLEAVIEAAPTVESFTIRLGAPSDAVATDAQNTPLNPLPWGVQTRDFVIDNELFADDFESSNTSAWSSTVP